jgi:histidyl-tRNA synthetase
MAQKPSIPKGTRDFTPDEMVKRSFIFDTIRTVFRKYGFLPIETPSMENLETLTGKYGEEGDQLIFKVLNSRPHEARDTAKELMLSEFGKALRQNTNSPLLTEKALRYDLTVPFARYVVMHQHEITFPFRRYQIQPVWRADRPQRGRYREFYQCDADIVGSDSLINEAELVLIYDEALTRLGLKDVTIKINNRKILAGIAETIGEADKIIDITVAIDKLDKIGIEGVSQELAAKGVSAAAIGQLQPVIATQGSNMEKLEVLRTLLASSAVGMKGIAETEELFGCLSLVSPGSAVLELDITLARGLNYYTGAIFEVKAGGVSIGSIGGGGRYDDLTGIFGLPGVSGVGISFGADRIYDVLEELRLFPSFDNSSTQALVVTFDEETSRHGFVLLAHLRNEGVNAEMYPAPVKLKKQMAYADSKKIPWVILVGSEEIKQEQYTLKDMRTGEQSALDIAGLITRLTR